MQWESLRFTVTRHMLWFLEPDPTHRPAPPRIAPHRIAPPALRALCPCLSQADGGRSLADLSHVSPRRSGSCPAIEG
eukprot:scaffold20150_cov33-Phaeocystis_antarctica.AAC.1